MKRVLVTGGSRGLGLALCRALAEAGWEVSTVARSAGAGLQEAVREFPGRIQFCQADLAKGSELDRICAELRVHEGFDGFVANAAAGTDGLLTLTPRARIEECIQLNLTSAILLTREVIKGMLPRGGSLVFVSSVSARAGLSGLSVYSATKGGLLAFSRSLAREYGTRGIRSNCVLPGFLETDMTESLSAADKERIRRRTPLARLGTVNEVLPAVTFLLSDAARFVTGGEFVVDGGFSV